MPSSEHPPHSIKRDFSGTLTHLCLLSGLGTTNRTTGFEPNTELLLPEPGKGFQMERLRAVTRLQGEQSLVGSPSCWAQTRLAVSCFPWISSGALQKLEPRAQSRVRGISRCFLTELVLQAWPGQQEEAGLASHIPRVLLATSTICWATGNSPEL